MTNEEFQKIILKKFDTLEAEVKNIKTVMADKDDIAKLPTREEYKSEISRLEGKIDKIADISQSDIYSLLEVMDKKLNTIQETQRTQGESINILALRQLQTESEVKVLQKRK